MPLYHNDDQAMLKDSVAPFVAEQAPVSHLRKLRDSADATGFSRDLWAQFTEMGLPGMLVPEAHGGLGMGHMEAGIVLEEIGRNLTPSPFLSTSVGAVAALAKAGGTQAGRWLPAIASGEAIVALAIDEGAKHRPDRIATTATRAGNGFRLDGKKSFVLHGHVADMSIVAAKTDGGITLFAVPKDAKGLTADPRRLVDLSLASHVTLDGVEVDADAVIGEVDAGGDVLDALLAATRTGAAAEMVGVGQGAMDMTVNYLKERKQFGKLIGEFQRPPAPRRASLWRDGSRARHGDEGAAAARRRQRGREADGLGRQGEGRPRCQPRGARGRADARRHRHDRRI